jgi:predicted RNA binding protein YcfA (HicA-like mRNA interferase family)
VTSQIDIRTLIRWLIAHDFVEEKGKATGHRRFVHREPKLVISIPGHGPNDLTKKHVGMILRALSSIGFEKEEVRRELERL